MEFFFNDLSLHKQFHDLNTFCSAVECVMNIRNIIKRSGRELYCHHQVASMQQVIRDKKMQQAIQYLSREQRIAWTQWIIQHGPFWEDDRRHDGGDYLECNGKIVTDKAVGEAAYCLFHGIECGLVSMNPSSWCSSPLLVVWHDNAHERNVDLTNYWDAETLRKVLETANKPLQSWEELEKTANARPKGRRYIKSILPVIMLGFLTLQTLRRQSSRKILHFHIRTLQIPCSARGTAR